MDTFAEFERSIIKEHQEEGILLAKKKGKYLERIKYLAINKLTKLIRCVMSVIKLLKYVKNLVLQEVQFTNTSTRNDYPKLTVS